MLDKKELEQFEKNFKYLQNKALAYLINNKWADKIDKNVKITMPMINEQGVHFELIHNMIHRIEDEVLLTWKQINELED
jgi:hypothetical protein